MSATETAAIGEPGRLGPRDRLAIILVGSAHGCSHFFQLVLPPLFPFLLDEMQVGYADLGLVMAAFFVTSGFGQPLAGFAVDRFGARSVLFFGLAVYSLAILALSIATDVWMLAAIMMVAGTGNCVFHPADYTVLSASVRSSHMGRAFSVHTLGGNLGWVIAPGFVLGIASMAGWRASVAAAGLVGVVIWLVLWSYRGVLKDEPETAEERATKANRQTPALSVAVLLSPTIALCFAYFALIAAALIGVQNFIGPILAEIHGFPLVLAGVALTSFLLGSSAGVLAGGVAADRTTAHTSVIIWGLTASATAMVLVAYVPSVEGILIGLLFAAGFLSGMTSPSRDMLVRSVTPRGATGRVFGFVYSGLDAGSAFAPVTIGLMLDHQRPVLGLWTIAVLLLLAIPTVVGIRGQVPAKP